MTAKGRSWKEVIGRRREVNFVGRAEYLRVFAQNFETEEPAFLLFSVTGEGGVGKSSLLKQYEGIANGPTVGAIVIICDDGQLSPAAAMGHVSGELSRFGVAFKEFDECYKTYRARKEEIEADPRAPRGALNLVVRGMTDFAIKASRRAPGVGIFAEYVNEKDAGEALTQGVNYLIDRIGNKDEVELLREPERILTPLFIELLNKACEKHRLVLMFDVFERTREALEPWLLELLGFKYGDYQTGLTFVISGREPLDQRWTQMGSSICHVTLEPFTLEETRLYLSHRGIVDEQLVALIHENTGGLPVLVELLAGADPKPGLPLPDISKDAVKRFLQWIPEEERRRVALLASVPRQFNCDVLAAALGGDGAKEFGWISTQSYIRTNTTRGWFYHEKVRELMLRHVHNTRPNDLAAAHARLAGLFQRLQNELGLEDEAAYSSESWRKLEVERGYHLVSERPEANLCQVINGFLRAFRWRWGLGEGIAQACQQAGNEMASHEVKEWAHALTEFYHAYDKDRYEEVVVQATRIMGRTDLDPVAQACVVAHRGWGYRQMGKQEEALVDFDRAIALDEKYMWAVVNRGGVHMVMDKYEQALADFDRAIVANYRAASMLVVQGIVHELMGRQEAALVDFDRALALDEKSVVAATCRGGFIGRWASMRRHWRTLTVPSPLMRNTHGHLRAGARPIARWGRMRRQWRTLTVPSPLMRSTHGHLRAVV